MDKVQDLKIPLEDIIGATKNFDKQNFIAKGGFGSVYKGELRSADGVTEVAVKRLDPESEQGKHEFMMEITTLSSYRHKNLVCLVGFCDVGTEKILVYEHESKGSLDRYIHNADELTWIKRLKISIGAARGLNYLHDEVGQQHRVLHRDIKSANILLSKDWDAKVADFGLSKIGPANVQHTFLVTAAAGTFGYLDPVYYNTGVLTKESDVYSFGVVDAFPEPYLRPPPWPDPLETLAQAFCDTPYDGFCLSLILHGNYPRIKTPRPHVPAS